MDKKIENVVFYKFYGENGEMEQACIFYADGTVKNTSVEEGLEVASKNAKAERLTREELRNAINNKNYHAMSGKEFERRFKEFLGKGTSLAVVPEKNLSLVPQDEKNNTYRLVPREKTEIRTARNTSKETSPSTTAAQDGTYRGVPGERTEFRRQQRTENTPKENPTTPVQDGTYRGVSGERTEFRRQQRTENTPKENPTTPVQDGTYRGVPGERTEFRRPENNEKNNEFVTRFSPVVPPVGKSAERKTTPVQDGTYRGVPGERTEFRRPENNRKNDEFVTRHSPVVPPVGNPTETKENTNPIEKTPVSTVAGAERPSESNTGNETIADKKANKKSWWQKFKESKFTKRATALLTAAGILLGGVAGWLLKGTKAGDIIKNNIGIFSSQNEEDSIEPQDVAYLNLLAETRNEVLRTIMTRQGQNLDIFNRDFANAHLEEGKDIKAALTWDEMMALNLAYNDYSKEEIALMFNGAEVDSKAMTDAYKNGTLQLMCAYVIETRENPVNSAMFVNDPEGRAFVEKYNDLFLRCKETTGEEQIAAINAFYAELHKDFPITDEQRAIGISHADDRATIKPYMLAVVPIVGASEMMFQNIGEIDHTMSDKAIDYFNDIGLCNLAEEKFERVEVITIMNPTDESLPTYDEYRETKIKELVAEGNYVIDDEHRDLSQLSEFQKWVNGMGMDSTYTYTVTSTYTVTTTHTETETYETDDRDEAVEKAGEEAVEKAEDEVDQQIEEENEQAKEEAEEEAKEKEEELQEEADREREELEEEVAENDEELQEEIEDANEDIENGETVNEDDFGDHGVDFDDDHSDENGNLDDSVEDITTDGTGAVEPGTGLPDPNETGAEFDAQADNSSAHTASIASEEPVNNTTSEANTTSDEVTYTGDTYEYEEAYTPSSMTNEELVDAYIASLEGQGSEEQTYGHSK